MLTENPSLESFIKLVSESGNSDITITYARDEIENTMWLLQI